MRVPLDIAPRSAGRVACALAFAAIATSCGHRLGSVGAVLAEDHDTGALHVRDVPTGLAAAEAGLVPGDELIMIDGRYVRELDSLAVRRLLRGQPGERVVLTVVRGYEVRRVEVTRTPLRAPPESEPSRPD